MRVVEDTIIVLSHFLQLQRLPTVTFFWFHMFRHLLLIVVSPMTHQVFATTFLTWQVTKLEVKVSPLVSLGSAIMDQDVKEVVELIGGLLNSAKGTGS